MNDISDGVWYNNPNGLEPLAFSIYTESLADIGSYIYYIEARQSFINLQDFYYR